MKMIMIRNKVVFYIIMVLWGFIEFIVEADWWELGAVKRLEKRTRW